MTTHYYDSLETRDPEAREANLFAALRDHLRAAMRAPAIARLLAGTDPDAVTNRDALAGLPVIRKSELMALQADSPPFGGLTSGAIEEFSNVFASPGPIFEPMPRRPDPFRMARALFAAGVRKGDLVHNTFSYHFTPAGAMLESGARAIGCTVFPAGVGQTELQVQAIARLRPNAYVGTPSFLNILLDKAVELDADVSSITKGLVSGEALPPSLRAAIRERGVSVLQCYAVADVGLIAYESPALEGMVLDEGVILEIVRPGTGDPVAEGEVGEIVVTPLNPDYPLVRFATGDLTAVMPGTSPCGRTNTRVRGWMGRADQTTKVRGMFVHPSQVAEVVRRHVEIVRARLVVTSVDNQDVMTLRCESGSDDPAIVGAIAGTVRDVCKLRGAIEIVEPGTLANDGKVIEDARTYE
ncbi:MAG: AMP-binding protein [Thiotrichales bacterium]|nr:AMP-binding protein [Thiotrichales bacterium]